MEHSFPQQGSKAQQTNSLLASLQFLDGIIKWLVRLFRLTDKEQDDAGIYLSDQDYK
jgi:hypothetical protein